MTFNPRFPKLMVLATLMPLTGLVSLATPSPVAAQSLSTAAVVSVGDGDTLRVRQAGQTLTIRLGCVDAPERNQPGGKQSAQRLQQLLPQGQTVQLRQINTDHYGRTVAELFLNGRSLNLQLVREGMVVIYPRYLGGCSTTQNQYRQAEQQARTAHVGFWSQAKPVMPWDWRRQHKY